MYDTHVIDGMCNDNPVHVTVLHWLVCVEGRRRISRSDLTQDIKMGSCLTFHINR